MPRIEWDHSFSVNNDEIDKQHKKWIAIINDLHDSLIKGNINEIDYSAMEAMKSMREYVKDHFTYEEDYMKSINYPDLAKHQNIHSKFYVQISEYYDDLKSGKLVLNTRIMKILMNWLKDHILNEDKKYNIFASGER